MLDRQEYPSDSGNRETGTQNCAELGLHLESNQVYIVDRWITATIDLAPSIYCVDFLKSDDLWAAVFCGETDFVGQWAMPDRACGAADGPVDLPNLVSLTPLIR